MAGDPDQNVALRAALRDLVALSTIPAAWVGREPGAISAGLADVLVGSLCLDFAFVRLCDPKGGTAVEATRGNTWRAFPDWLEGHGRPLSRREIIPDVGGPGTCRGVVIPIGVDGEGGLVATACARSDFPSEIDQLLLSVAANQASTAFQSARLVHERRQGEEALRQSEQELRRARDQLEMKVEERTAELRRSQAYLAEAQRLSHTGSFGWEIGSGEIFWSEETYRIFEYPPSLKVTVELVLARTHPDDRAFVRELVDRAEREKKPFDFEHRLLMPGGSVKYVEVVGAPAQKEKSGNLEFLGSIMDITERKRVEEALRRSEAYLADAQQLSHTGSWAVDAVTKEMIHSSDEHSRLFGLDPRDGLPAFETLVQRMHPEDRGRTLDGLEKAIREGTDFEVDCRLVLPDGVVKFVHGVGHPVFSASGELIRFFGTTVDVTERKRADEEREQLLLRERVALAEVVAAQRRFTDLVNSVEGIVWEADATTFRFSFVSKPAERILGYPVERWLSEPTFWKDHLHPADQEWAVTFCVKATSEKRDHDFEYRMIAADGSIVWLRDIVTVVVERDRATRLRGVMIDITERKRADYLTSQVFESSPDGVMIIGRDYRYQRVNPIYEHRAGIAAEKIVGMHVADLLGTEPFEKLKPNLDRCFAGEEVSFADWISSALGRKYLSVSYSPLRPDSDRVEAALVIARDLTEHMLASEGLAQAQADLAHISRVTTMGELAASLAHEVNQPIAAAVTNANTCLRWLARDSPDVNEAREAASRMVKTVSRAAEIVSRVRTLFRKGAPQREWVEVNEVIREMLLLLRSETSRYSISLRTELAPDLPQVMADRVQLQQVIMNLMLNGVEALREANGTRELAVKSARTGAEQLVISVSDTGVGLPSGQADQIFNAFFTTKPNGTGMGLPISRSIVESHGGRLWAAANPGSGTTFFFSLPTQGEAHE
jgi:PAS domain S-box-containing protein